MAEGISAYLPFLLPYAGGGAEVDDALLPSS